MGMYSTFVGQNIDIKNHEGVKKVMEEFDTMDLIDELTEGTMDVDFCNWDTHKIEGYWYDETVNILRALAPFVEGYAEFMYEEGYNFRILFENGKVYTQRAELVWNNKEEL